MTSEIMVALLSCAGTAIGGFFGIMKSQKLTDFRLKTLETKVDKHNTVIEKTFRLEEQMKVANHRIDDLEKER